MNVPATFPGNEVFYNTVDDQSYAPSIADMSVWASTTEQCRNEDFVHVNGDIIMWRYHWEAIGKYFGLEVSSPYSFDIFVGNQTIKILGMFLR